MYEANPLEHDKQVKKQHERNEKARIVNKIY